MNLREDELHALIRRALDEDMPFGDLTSELLIEDDRQGTADALVKGAPLVAAGVHVAGEVFRLIDASSRFWAKAADGEMVQPGESLFRVEGMARTLLAGERVALNLLQRICGIATETRAFVDAVAGTGVKILDTRKTTPGLRALEKYAVAAGGGQNHRFSLSDGILIKENHISAAGGIRPAVAAALARRSGHLLRIEVEVSDLDQVAEALEAGAEMLLLDNFLPEEVRRAVALVQKRIPLEVSGGVTLDTVRAFAEAGPDFISIGHLTHSAPACDISLLFGAPGPAISCH
jgi:nicotinate-nucleotide pyrophosphorylase (carboxylating)